MNKFSLLMICFLATACTHLTFVRDANRAPETAAAAQNFYLQHYAWGLFSGPPLPNAKQACPAGHLQSVDLRMSTGDVLLTLVTVGLYVPHRAELVCAKNI